MDPEEGRKRYDAWAAMSQEKAGEEHQGEEIPEMVTRYGGSSTGRSAADKYNSHVGLIRKIWCKFWLQCDGIRHLTVKLIGRARRHRAQKKSRKVKPSLVSNGMPLSGPVWPFFLGANQGPFLFIWGFGMYWKCIRLENRGEFLSRGVGTSFLS